MAEEIDNMHALDENKTLGNGAPKFNIYNTKRHEEEDFLKALLHTAQHATTTWLADQENPAKLLDFQQAQRDLSANLGGHLYYKTLQQVADPTPIDYLSILEDPIRDGSSFSLAVELTENSLSKKETHHTVLTDYQLFTDQLDWSKKDVLKTVAACAHGAAYLVNYQVKHALDYICNEGIKKTGLTSNAEKVVMQDHNPMQWREYSTTYNEQPFQFKARAVQGTVLPTKQEAFHNPLRLLKIIADLTSFDRFNNYIKLELVINGADTYVFKFYMFRPNCFQISHVGYVSSDPGLNGEILPSDINPVNLNDRMSGMKITYGFGKGESKNLADLLHLHAHLSANDLKHIQQNRFGSEAINVLPPNYNWKPALKERRYFGNGYVFNYDNSYTVIANTTASPFQSQRAANLNGTFYTIIKWNTNTPTFGVKAEVAHLRQHYTELSTQVHELTRLQKNLVLPATNQTTQGYIATVQQNGKDGCFLLDDVNIFDYDVVETRRRAIEHDMFRRYYQEEIHDQAEKNGTGRKYTRYNAIYDLLKENGELPSNATQFPGLFGHLLHKLPKEDVVANYTLQIKMSLDALGVSYTFVPVDEYETNATLKRVLLKIQIAHDRRMLLARHSMHRFLLPSEARDHGMQRDEAYTQQFPTMQESAGRLSNPRFHGRGGARGGRVFGRNRTFGDFIPGRGKKGRETDSEFCTQPDMHKLQEEIASLKRALNSTTLGALP